MSRRFTLFALLAAVCLLFTSCGALMLKAPVSNKGSLVIPLRASDRKASSPLELCTRFVFNIENANYKATAEGTTTIEFDEIPFDTYTLTGTAYGKLSEETGAQEEIVATCKVENLVIDSPEPKAVTATFVLSEATLIYFKGYEVEETDAQGTPITVVYTGTDKTTKISETKTTETTTTVIEYAIDANGNNTTVDGELFVSKETVTEPQSSGNKITITEYDYNAGDPRTSKVTVTEPNGDKTVSEYNLDDSTQGCVKRVTETTGNTTTVDKYDSNTAENPTDRVVTQIDNAASTTTITTYDDSNMTNPAKVQVIESTKTTTTEYLSSDKSKTDKETVVITKGANAGQTTETEYDTSLNKPDKITVTSPDNHKTVSTLDYSVANTVTTTTYLTDWIPGGGENGSAVAGNPDSYNISSTLVTTSSGTVQTDYTYVRGLTTYNEFGTDEQIPQDTITVITKDTGGNVVSTATTTYDYSTESLTNGKPNAITTVTTESGSTTTSAKVYTYDEYGRVTAETLYSATGVWIDGGVLDVGSFCIDGNKVAASSCTYDYVKMGVYVFGLSSPYGISSGVATTSSSWKTTDALFSVTASEQNAIRCKNGATVSKDEILQFLQDNYVVCGDTLAEIDWVTNDTKAKAESRSFAYIYKADLQAFATYHSGCFGYKIEGNNIYCVIHNTKSGCGVWNTTKIDKDGNSQKFSTRFYDNNIGTAGNW